MLNILKRLYFHISGSDTQGLNENSYIYRKIFKLKSPIFLLLFLSFYSIAFSQRSKVEASINYLSSDELKGRENGSPELLEAANWIASEFKNIGLQSPSFAENYLQEVNLLSVENQYKSLILNDLAISDDRFFVLGQKENFQITKPNGLEVFVVGEQDDIMSVFSQINQFDNSFAVIIHPIHIKRFERIKRYFTNSKRELENEEANYSLWVMSDEKSIQSIDLSVINKLNRTTIYNVIGELPAASSSDRKWMFSSHYDHLGIINSDGDSIANGANDDASGVAAVIELARMFSNGEAPEKSIYFIAFAGEELGIFGSKYLSSIIELDKIEAMINIEMIGIPNTDLGPQSAYITGYDLSYLPKDMANNTQVEKFMFFPDPYSYLNLFNRSDNASFASLGVPAHSVSTFSENDNTYHSVNDEVENMDIDHIMEVIEAIYESTLPLLKLDYDPGVIDYKTKTDR